MAPASTIEPITVLKTKSAELVRRARRSRQPVIITQNGKATAVLQDMESFEEQRQALLLLKLIAQGDRELRAGHGIPHDEAMNVIEATLRGRMDVNE